MHDTPNPKIFRCQVFPGKMEQTFGSSKDYHQVYSFWKELWTRELIATGGDASAFAGDDFRRQSAVITLWHDDTLIGLVANTTYMFDVPADRDCKFFRVLSSENTAELLARGVKLVSSIEFLSVHPEWRGSKIGVSMGALLIEMSLRRAKDIGADVSL